MHIVPLQSRCIDYYLEGRFFATATAKKDVHKFEQAVQNLFQGHALSYLSYNCIHNFKTKVASES